jgi:hypothetical protein
MEERPPQEPSLPSAEEPSGAGPGSDIPPEAPSTKPSWEHTDQYGFFGALIKTIGEVLFHPENTFRNLKTGGGIGAPFLFGWLLQSICQLIALSQARSIILKQLDWYLPRSFHGNLPPDFDIYPWFDFFPAMIVIIPIGVAIWLFIMTGILHICLMIVGGANKDIDVTFRVAAYSQGATAPWNIIPFVGNLVGSVWQLICVIIGLKESHQTSIGKVILAILLPLIVCCGLGIIFMGLALGM